MNQFRNPRSGDLLAEELTNHEIGVLSIVRSTGSANMANRGVVLDVLAQLGWYQEHDRLGQLSPVEWGLALDRMVEFDKVGVQA